MTKYLLSILLMLNLLPQFFMAQACEITAVNTVILPCVGNQFNVSVNLDVINPSSPGFTLAGNGVIYGTYLYSDLPVTVGPLLGDDESLYEFIAWDVENADCQQYTILPAANCGPICSISNFVLEFIDCVSNQGAIVVFDFDYVNPPSVTFDLLNEEGEEIGTYLYSSLPVTLPFFQVYGAAPIILTVCDHNNSSCCETFILDAIDCNPNNCEIFSENVNPECTGNNFIAHLDFGYDNPASDSFTVTGNTLNYGTFGYNELPLALGPLNGNSNIIWEFIITDTEASSCNATEILGIYNCPPPCNVQALEALALECNGNEAYALEIGLDIEGEGDNGFAVFSETTYYGSFAYNTLPLTIAAFESTCEFVDFVSVCDNENPGCCATTPFETLLCCGCLIYNLTATALPCNAENQIYVEINFDFQNVSTAGFEITGNSSNYGQFLYGDLPVQVGPFLGDGTQYFEFVVTDLDNGLCFEAVELGFINCTQICELTNLVVETGACTGNNQYILDLDFDFQGIGDSGFDLTLNGDFFGSYDYDDLPLSFDDFPSTGPGPDTITVCDNETALCCATIIFDSPDCQCQIFDATAQILDCTSDTTFAISLEFFTENFPGTFVDISLDGDFLGFFPIDPLPLIITIPEGDGSAILTICANDLESCCDEVLIELVTCVNLTCNIWDLFAEAGECTSDTSYEVDIVFNHENVVPDSVIISANGQSIGQFQIQPDFIHIENFPVLDSNTTTITVCAAGDSTCCDTYTFETKDCSLFGQCYISELVAETGNCTSDSSYALHINFDYQELPSDTVTVTANGNFIGQFQILPDGIGIENFPVYETDTTVLIVCAAGDPACCDTLEFETQDCTGCHLFDLVADPGECLSDTTFVLFVHYTSFNLGSDSVTVVANDNFIGQFPHNPDGFNIQNFPVFLSGQTFITICSAGAPDCCDSFTFETPDCGQCHIFDMIAEAGECNSDSTFSLDIAFESTNLPSDSVTVQANDQNLGTYFIAPDFIHIENFPVFESAETTITVCALGAPDCCDTYTIATPVCTDECIIYDVSVDVDDCNSDSTFGVVINFLYQNVDGGFDIYSDVGYLGFFTFEQIPVAIGDFPANESGEYVITICEADSTSCCTSFEFEGPVCGPQGCDISELGYTLTTCDSAGNFYFILHFDFSNTGISGFNVVGNGNNYGNFSYEQEPVAIGPFPSDNTVFEFLVSDAENPACFDFIEPGQVECLVSTIPIDYDQYFQIHNNGTVPGIYARKNVTLSLFNSNGKNILDGIRLSTDSYYEITTLPEGFYIATITFENHMWPVKLIKAGY